MAATSNAPESPAWSLKHERQASCSPGPWRATCTPHPHEQPPTPLPPRDPRALETEAREVHGQRPQTARRVAGRCTKSATVAAPTPTCPPSRRPTASTRTYAKVGGRLARRVHELDVGGGTCGEGGSECCRVAAVLILEGHGDTGAASSGTRTFLAADEGDHHADERRGSRSGSVGLRAAVARGAAARGAAARGAAAWAAAVRAAAAELEHRRACHGGAAWKGEWASGRAVLVEVECGTHEEVPERMSERAKKIMSSQPTSPVHGQEAHHLQRKTLLAPIWWRQEKRGVRARIRQLRSQRAASVGGGTGSRPSRLGKAREARSSACEAADLAGKLRRPFWGVSDRVGPRDPSQCSVSAKPRRVRNRSDRCLRVASV